MKLLIVDDDDYTRLGLLESVKWSAFGIEEIKEARDGAEALREAASFKPDIVITDIRMPKLSGIEFAEKLLDRCNESKLLFMSGFMEVDYLKSAIKLSAVDYIEKPIKLPDLELAVMKAVNSIRLQQEGQIILAEKLKLQRQRLTESLKSGMVIQGEVLPICKEIGFQANSHYVCIVSSVMTKQSDQVLDTEMHQAFWDAHKYPSLNVREDQNRILTIVALKHDELSKVRQLCHHLIHQNNELIIGMGLKAAALEGIADSYRTANRTLELSFYRPEQRLFCFEAKKLSESGMDLYSDFFSIYKKTPEQLPHWLDSLCGKIKEDEYLRRERVCNLFLSFAQAILLEKPTVLARLNHVSSQGDVEKDILESPSIDELRSFMKIIFTAYIEDLRESISYSSIVREVMNFVAANYRNADLDVREISEHVHMSASHLSYLFKNETGFTLKQYIGDYRLELAKKMILDEHYKINTIAERCGFASPSYFTKVFRASTNLTPIEYRKLGTQ
ncbi:two-component system response regulator YesN [Fontibacillus phaseoli]|uniref:Two-component system response regulator YesN n=1 Tax=Fontibacillus phaseoli TaxID=1416533 RepID=A0A369BLT4_9BACL|nr:helix-turn-helix domain-containing protein [Fontibacillus phaseoli]RCX21556.1 two-component system response regulator YesN [Fontibacillus phaseoli]